MENIQPIIKQNLLISGILDVHSYFQTIQGEGPFSGAPSLFIRLHGCNLQCPKCDTDYTSKSSLFSVKYLVKIVKKLTPKTKLVVITGGEPFRQNIAPLINSLLSKGYTVQIETNGTLFNEDLNYGHDQLFIICSPKTGKVNKKLQEHIYAYKYVLDAFDQAEDDGLPNHALGHPAKPRLFRPEHPDEEIIFIQPIDEGEDTDGYIKLNKRHLNASIKSAMTHGYILCTQLHKQIGLE